MHAPQGIFSITCLTSSGRNQSTFPLKALHRNPPQKPTRGLRLTAMCYGRALLEPARKFTRFFVLFSVAYKGMHCLPANHGLLLLCPRKPKAGSGVLPWPVALLQSHSNRHNNKYPSPIVNTALAVSLPNKINQSLVSETATRWH